MAAPISSITPISVPDISTSITKSASGSGEFHNLLSESISNVEQQQSNAQVAVNSFLTGESGELHTAAIATQKAELSLQLFMQVRNKVVSAYQEVMRMQM